MRAASSSVRHVRQEPRGDAHPPNVAPDGAPVPPALLGRADDGEAVGRMGGDRSAPMASPNPAQREHGADARSSCGPFPSPCGTRPIADGRHRLRAHRDSSPTSKRSTTRKPTICSSWCAQNPERYLIDPSSPRAVQAAAEQTQQVRGRTRRRSSATTSSKPRPSRCGKVKDATAEMGGRARLQVLPSGPRRRGQGHGDRSEN